MPDTIPLEQLWPVPVSGLPRDPVEAALPPLSTELPPPPPAARPTRHLPDRILTAVHEACDLGALHIATDLLRILEQVVSDMQQTSPTARRRSMEGLVAAHDRIWHLRHERRLALNDPFAALR